MTVLVGRRRIGKTKLAKKAFDKKVYFFISRKSESLLCEEFVSIVQETLSIKLYGQFESFPSLFENLMVLSKDSPFTLVIDEFQDLLHINPSIYSDMQNIWDEHKDSTKMNLVVSGSIYSLMKKIFEDKKEPLFGRADTIIHLKSFTIDTLIEILGDHYPDFNQDDLLSLYILTGGVAKYIEIFVNHHAFTLTDQLDVIFHEFSPFIEEGKNQLVEEFGKEYTVYFSILSLISSSKTSRSEIESILEKKVGGYLDRLENEYSIISKKKPIFAKEGGRTVKYEISDNFINFWFRFIYKHRSAIELENYGYVKDIVKRDYETYSGRFLEKYFQEKLRLTQAFSQIGNYWEKGNQNEIDIVAVNDELKTLLIGEVKRNPKRISMTKLKEKSNLIIQQKKGYAVRYEGFSLEDMLD